MVNQVEGMVSTLDEDTGKADPATKAATPSPAHVSKGDQGQGPAKHSNDATTPIFASLGAVGALSIYNQYLNIAKDAQTDHNGNKVEYIKFYATPDGLKYDLNGKRYRIVAVNEEGLHQGKKAPGKQRDTGEETPPISATPESGAAQASPVQSGSPSVDKI